MKQLVGVDIGSYSFDAVAKTISFSNCGTLTLDNILLITNVTDHIIIYNFADTATTGTLSSNILTLTYNTSSMSNTDNLQIYVDVEDKTNKSLFFMLRQIFNAVISPMFLDSALARARTTSVVESGTVTTVTGVTNLGSYSANTPIELIQLTAWQNYRNLLV